MAREYRRLSVSDLEMVMRLNETYRQGFANRENAYAFLVQPQNWFFACVEDGHILGFCQGYACVRLNEAGALLYIHELAVLPAYRRQGIGKAMLDTLKILCRLSGIRRLFLITQQSNQPARALYDSARGRPAHRDDLVYVFDDLTVP